MKKNKIFFKPIILIFILLISIFLFSSCSTNKNNENTENNFIPSSTISLNGIQIHTLSQCIAIIPPFENIKKVNDEFWNDFVYNFYTHKTVNEGTTIIDKDNKTWLVVKKEEIDAVVQFLFGSSFPNYLPHEENLYYNDGLYFIQLSDPDGDAEIIANYIIYNKSAEKSRNNCKL